MAALPMSKSQAASLRRCIRPKAPIAQASASISRARSSCRRSLTATSISTRPIEARASALIRTLIANGTTRTRSHVDIDNDVGLANLEAVLRVREAYKDWIDIQLVAFPQSGVTTEKGAPELMAAALSAGADLIGGLDPAGFDGDAKGQLDIVFGLADRFGKGIDIHLHDGGETGASELRDIAERTIAAGMQGRVAVSHAFALGSIGPDLFAETADALARAEVA